MAAPIDVHALAGELLQRATGDSAGRAAHSLRAEEQSVVLLTVAMPAPVGGRRGGTRRNVGG